MAWTTGIRPDVNWQPLTSPNYISAHMRHSATRPQLRTVAPCKPGLLCLHGRGHAAPVCALYPKTYLFSSSTKLRTILHKVRSTSTPETAGPLLLFVRWHPTLHGILPHSNKCPSIDTAGCLKRLQQPLTAAKLCVGQPQLSARPTALAYVPTPFTSDSPLIRRGWQSLMKLSCKG